MRRRGCVRVPAWTLPRHGGQGNTPSRRRGRLQRVDAPIPVAVTATLARYTRGTSRVVWRPGNRAAQQFAGHALWWVNTTPPAAAVRRPPASPSVGGSWQCPRPAALDYTTERRRLDEILALAGLNHLEQMIRAIQDGLPGIQKVFRARLVPAATLDPLACVHEGMRALSLQQGRLDTRVTIQHVLDEGPALRQRAMALGLGRKRAAKRFHAGDYSSSAAACGWPPSLAARQMREGGAPAFPDRSQPVRRRQAPGMPCTGRGAGIIAGAGVGFAMGGSRATDSDS